MANDIYYDKCIEIISSLKGKKTLLLHACCGPCSVFPLLYLTPYFDITIYYNNSNIFPASEYDLRLNELKELLVKIKNDYNVTINLIETPYDYDTYFKDLETLKDEPECGKRCKICYEKRMFEAYKYADEHGFDYFTTVMTISRQKSSIVMNEIGEKLQSQFTTKYLYSDFKKKGGLLIAKKAQNHYGLYQQLYCGCEPSMKRLTKEK